jgi:hypothetical protein
VTDYTIASKVVPPNINPMAVAGQAQTLQQGMLQNRLLGAQLSGKTDVAGAISGATGPDGKVDWAKAASSLPAGSFGAPDLAERAISNQTQQQALVTAHILQQVQEQKLTQEQIATGAQENANAQQLANSIRATGDTSQANVTSMLDAATPTMFKSPTALQQVQDFKSKLTPDPTANDALLKNYGLLHGQVAGVLGQIRDVNLGATTDQVRNDVATGAPQTTGALQNTIPPTAMASRVSTVAPGSNQPTTVPLSATVDASGKPLQPGSPGAAPQLGPGGQLPSQPPLGAEATASAGGAGRANQGVAFEAGLAKAANGWAAQHSSLSQFGNLVDQIASGNKAGSLKKLGQFAAEFNLPAPVSKNDTAGLEEAGKLSQLIAQQQFQQLGGTGTDAKLESAMHTSPSEFLSQVGNKRILPLLQGLNDATKAQANLYQTWKAQHGPEDYADFINQWNQHFDPRAFQSAYMTPTDVAAMRASMGTQERANFDSFRAFAKQKGWLGGQ